MALPEVTQFVASVSTADRQGVSVTELLRRQSRQIRLSRALSAERHAMKLPVKLLAPLAICIFPCTFLVIAFPIAVRLSESGLF
jgi:tight adherence protein C